MTDSQDFKPTFKYFLEFWKVLSKSSNIFLPKFLPDLATQQVPPWKATEKLQQLLEVVPNSSAHIKALPAAYSFSFNNSLVQIHLRKSQRMQLKKDWSHPGSHTSLNNLYREHSHSRTSIFFPCPPLYYWIEIKKPYATNVYTRFICVQPNVVCVLVVFFCNPHLNFIFLLTSLCMST